MEQLSHLVACQVHFKYAYCKWYFPFCYLFPIVMAGTACTKTVSFVAKICQHATHILCKNVRVHFPDVHVMHRFHQSFIFRRAGKKLFSPLQERKKESKNNLANIPHDFYFLQEGRILFHLLVYILHTVHLFLKISRKSHHSISWMSRILHLRSSVWQLSAYTIIHCFCQLSTCLDFWVIQMQHVRKENKYVPWKMTQNSLETWGES